MKALCRLSILMMALAVFGALGQAADEAPRPNIVLILADDLGYMDIGANNPETFYETPVIDGLAAAGMRFTQGYSACCVCSPTRASIMTGKYPPRVQITDYIGGSRAQKLKPAPYSNHLSLLETTLAERLKSEGYATFFAGKWHLGDGEFQPNAHGFGPELKIDGRSQFYFPLDAAADPVNDPKNSDRIAAAAEAFIAANKDRPFFAYLPFQAVHTAIQAKQELVEKWLKKRELALPDKFIRDSGREVRQVQNHPIYAAMLEQMDSAIGRVVAALDQHGLSGRTIVVFTSDNGGLSTSEGTPTSNVPLRCGKGWPYEGGVRTPWIILAPGVTRPGDICDTPVITTDLYPTLLELAGLKLAPDQHRDGISLAPVLRGEKLDRRAPLFWHYPHYGNQGGAPHGAIRDGDWKLIEWYEDGRLELYHLTADVGEQINLAAREPDRTRAMHARLAAWRKEVGAIMPTPNPDFDPNIPPKQSAKPAAKTKPKASRAKDKLPAGT